MILMQNFCEILAPIADKKYTKKLIKAGADALYCGLSGFSSRPRTSDMTVEEIIKAKNIAAYYGVRLYVAINAVILNENIDEIQRNIKILDDNGIAAFIVSDMGLINLLTAQKLNADIHISTLTGVHNVETVRYYKELGCKRIILSSDLYIDEIADITDNERGIEYEIVADGGICYNNNHQCNLPHFNDKNEFCVLCQSDFEILKNGKFEKKALPIGNAPALIHRALGIYIGVGIKSFKIEGRTNDIGYVIKRIKAINKSRNIYYKNRKEIPGYLHYIYRKVDKERWQKDILD